jgi:excisionase family DNA binding protein
MAPRRLITTKQLASRLVVSERHIYRLMSAGKLPPPVRIGRCLRWKPENFPGLEDLGRDSQPSDDRR